MTKKLPYLFVEVNKGSHIELRDPTKTERDEAETRRQLNPVKIGTVNPVFSFFIPAGIDIEISNVVKEILN